MKDRNILRQVAGDYFVLAQQERFHENRKLHRAVFAMCGAQAAADKAKMAALREAKSTPPIPEEVRAKCLKAVADEDKAFADTKQALDEWSAAIARLKAAAEDYRKAEGEKADTVAAAAMRAAESQEDEHRKSVAKYEQGVQGWEKQRSLKP